jgi:LuxR family transcriptional regulator, maltose regulon positive regulatory protein
MTERAPALPPTAFDSFGALLRHLRRCAQLTQRELALAVGYSESQISRLEQGERLPDLAMLRAQFVPALALTDAPAWVDRLLELAATAHTAAPITSRLDAGPVGAANRPPVPSPLLATKLYLPRARPDLVPRPRLTTRLASALRVPLTLIAAPAGFGKTTLLASWLAQQPAPVASLALDGGDNDLTTFLRYLVAALQTIARGAGTATLALLETPQSLSPSLLLTPLLNDLLSLPHDSLLVLDDYHVITSPAVHASITFLLAHLPPPLHLIIASREDPPLPLARLRGQRQVLELRAAELRFTRAEVTAFLTEMMGVPLSPADVAALETRTEGWAVGLQLAALALQDRTDRGEFIAAFTGSNRYIADYLATEVLGRLPPHLRTFVLQTTILDRLCGPLCDALLGLTTDDRRPTTDDSTRAVVGGQWSVVDSFSQLILGQLERMNLFLVPLDDERGWYRYHHLFTEVVREQLVRGTTRETVATLHRRASAWYERQGLIAEGVQHALAAQDWERAGRLIEEHGLRLMVGGQVQTGLGWLNALPKAFIQMHPLLCIVHAIGLMLSNQADAAEVRLQDAERGLPPETSDELVRVVRGSVAGVRGRLLYLAGDLAEAIDSLHQALALLPETTTSAAAGITIAMARTAWAVYLATAYKVTGDVTGASERQAAQAIAPVRALGHMMATLNGYTSLAYLQQLQGRLHAAAVTYAEVERLVPGQDTLQALSGSPSYYVGMGDLLREWNQLDAAADYLARGMDLIQGTLATEADVIMLGYLALARVQQAQGDGAAALATLDAFVRQAHERQLFPLLIRPAAALQAQLQLLQGNLPAAIRWAKGSGLSCDDALSFPHEDAYLTLARVRIATGRAEEVLPLLDRLLEDAVAKGRMHSAIEIRVVQALAFDALGDRDRILRSLEGALVLAEPEGYIRTFVDEGPQLAVLLREAGTHGIAPAYVERILAAFPRIEGRGMAAESAEAGRSGLSPQSSTLVEPLSGRELAVLHLVAAGHTNQAIAQKLVIEVGTVKRHVHSILGKLGVQNRTQAIARARELGLL